MPPGPPKLFRSLLFEDDDLLALEILEHQPKDHGVVQNGRADVDLLAVLDEEDPVEMGFPPRREIEFLDGQDIAFFDAVLLAARHDHCVHGNLPVRQDKKVGRQI